MPDLKIKKTLKKYIPKMLKKKINLELFLNYW